MNNGLFQTHDFAVVCGTTKRTLIYYDELGLLVPAYRDSTGARYYEPQQTMSFLLIESLKDLGMRLSQIKDYINNQSPMDLQQTLIDQQAVIQAQIEKLKQYERVINTRVKMIEEADVQSEGVISITECPEEYFILSNPIDSNSIEKQQDYLLQHLRYCRKINCISGYPFAAMIHGKDILENNTSTYAFYGTKINSKVDDPHLHIKEAGEYITTYLYGDYRDHEEVFKLIRDYINKQELNIYGLAYKEAIVDELAAKRKEDYITKVSIRISK